MTAQAPLKLQTALVDPRTLELHDRTGLLWVSGFACSLSVKAEKQGVPS